jgi:hypothetical protein
MTGIKVLADGTMPVGRAMDTLMHDSSIMFYLLPLPAVKGSDSTPEVKKKQVHKEQQDTRKEHKTKKTFTKQHEVKGKKDKKEKKEKVAELDKTHQYRQMKMLRMKAKRAKWRFEGHAVSSSSRSSSSSSSSSD